MYKRLIKDFVKTEIEKGVPLEKIRKYLLKCGYNANDIDEILREYEIRENEIKIQRELLNKSRTRLKVLSAVIILLLVGNFVFFYFNGFTLYSNTNTITGYMATDKQEYLQEICKKYIEEKTNNTTNSSIT